MASSSLSLILLFLATSLVQIHARESRFFSKTLRVEASPGAEEPATALPPQSPYGYGLYGRDLDTRFPSTSTPANINGAAFSEPKTVPSSFTSAEFSTGQMNTNNAASTLTATYNPEYPDAETYEVKEYDSNAVKIPRSSSSEEFDRGSYETTKVPTYNLRNDDKRFGMSDTRFMEDGKYYYDVKGKRNSREYSYEPVKGNTERYGNGEYRSTTHNEVGAAENQNGEEMNGESQQPDDYVP